MSLKILSKADLAVLTVQGVTAGLNIIDWVYYDTLSVTNATTSLRFFQQAYGQGGTTLETTNMELPGQLPAKSAFIILEFGAEFVPGSVAAVPAYISDQVAALHAGHFQFYIGSRPFYQEKLIALAGGGLHGMSSVFGTANFFYAAARRAQNAKMEYMPKIDGSTSFAVTVDWDVAPAVAATGKLIVKARGKLVRESAA